MPGPKLTTEQWALLRAAFESGGYTDHKDFWKRFVTPRSRQFPIAYRTLHDRAGKEGWSKRAQQPALERLSAEMYARLGLPPEEAARTLVGFVKRGNKTAEEFLDYLKSLLEPGKQIDITEAVKGLIELGRRYLADANGAAKFLDQYHKVTGSYAAVKHVHSGKVALSHGLEGMTAEEHVAMAKKSIAFVEQCLAEGKAPWAQTP